jgi:hypothetical protein
MVDNSCQTDHCPRGHRCESCGIESPGLRVVTHSVLGAILCLTLCPRCASSGRLPQIMLSTAERLVAAHAEHLRGGEVVFRVVPRAPLGEDHEP